MQSGDSEQDPGGPAGDPATLFPVLQGAHADTHERRELCLGESICFPNGGDISLGNLEGSSSWFGIPENACPLANTGLEFLKQVIPHVYSVSLINTGNYTPMTYNKQSPWCGWARIHD